MSDRDLREATLKECEQHAIATKDFRMVWLLDRIKELEAKLQNWDRILRSTAGEEGKGCSSPVGAVQNKVVALEAELERKREETIEECAKIAYWFCPKELGLNHKVAEAIREKTKRK